jgi:hypothetical protein
MKNIKKIKHILVNLKHAIIFNKVNNRDIYFIISTGRTGTNFMESFLNAASQDVLCIHEPKPDLFDLSLEKIRLKKPSKVIMQKLKEARYEILNETLKKNKRKYIESNPFATFLIPEINKVFKNVKFIFIYRDIETYLLSALNKSPRGNGVNNFYAEDDNRKRLRPADFENDEHAEIWLSLSRAQKITWYWNKCNLYLRTFAKENNNQVIELKFEDLFSKDKETKKATLTQLFAFTDINFSPSRLDEILLVSSDKRNQTEEKFYSSLKELSESELKWIKTVTKELKTELGYPIFQTKAL